MKQFKKVHIPLYSFFSKDLYKDVCLRWKGTNLLYLLLLITLLGILPMVKFQTGMVDVIDNYLPEIVSQIPEYTIENGRASIDEPQPYHIYDPETGSPLITIDTTGKINNLEKSEAVLLATSTHVIVEESDTETNSYSIKNINYFTLNQSKINGWLEQGKKFLTIISYPIVVFGIFIGRAFQALIYTLIAMAMAHFLSTKRSFQELFRLTVVAITPSIILKAVISLFSFSLPGFLNVLIVLGFLFFGIHAVSKDSDRASEVPVKA